MAVRFAGRIVALRVVSEAWSRGGTVARRGGYSRRARWRDLKGGREILYYSI